MGILGNQGLRLHPKFSFSGAHKFYIINLITKISQYVVNFLKRCTISTCMHTSICHVQIFAHNKCFTIVLNESWYIFLFKFNLIINSWWQVLLWFLSIPTDHTTFNIVCLVRTSSFSKRKIILTSSSKKWYFEACITEIKGKRA